MLWLADEPLPMPEPHFSPNGTLLTYTCPLGCSWEIWCDVPSFESLDSHVKTARKTVSDHYETAHGVVPLWEDWARSKIEEALEFIQEPLIYKNRSERGYRD